MDKGLTIPKWVLINWPKIPKCPQTLSARIVFPSPNVWNFDEKRLYWASVVRATNVDILRHKSRQTAFRIPSAIQNKTYNIINFPFSHFQHVPSKRRFSWWKMMINGQGFISIVGHFKWMDIFTFSTWPTIGLVKFIFSKKATKIYKIFNIDLTFTTKRQIHSEDFCQFVWPS